MTLKPVPQEVYLARGRDENEYTQQQMAAGTLRELFVTPDHRNYWMVFDVADEEALRAIIRGFPLHDYFEYECRPVMDMVALVKSGFSDPNLA